VCVWGGDTHVEGGRVVAGWELPQTTCPRVLSYSPPTRVSPVPTSTFQAGPAYLTWPFSTTTTATSIPTTLFPPPQLLTTPISIAAPMMPTCHNLRRNQHRIQTQNQTRNQHQCRNQYRNQHYNQYYDNTTRQAVAGHRDPSPG